MTQRRVRPIPGQITFTTLVAAIAVHEFMCIATNEPDELITRVVERWRARHPATVTLTVIYIAGHLLGAWPHDPLSAGTWHQARVTWERWFR